MKTAALAKGTMTVALMALLAGCSATPQALEDSSNATSQNFTANYLEVYQRVATTSTRCLASPGARMGAVDLGSIEVQSELHQDRGFGDVRFAVIGSFSANYFVAAKIEKSGNGSRVSVKVNNPLIGERLANMVFRWAAGEQGC